MRAYVGVGSNLGDRWAHLALAARELRACPGVTFLRGSRVHDAAPMGPSQPRYLNAVVELETTLEPEALLERLLAVEQAAFRERGLRWGARTLDLDLLLCDDLVVRSPTLTVPHPGLISRRWVLAPLAELCPDRLVPGTGCTVAELLKAVPAYDMKPVGLYPG
ncbi:2-amino-4-hydroxy-6-hydroxymethyldihydropteridine diphosphokinase [Anaeromyxobacter diazotrophicus]|uniref:2-amino-4-hydroxy-6-hydroxymethyldihydropteridine pyrophosphokinase n=1 Tax=Anaeromyxobacter diazotrophicus TaxID=2590199 RepID=A0A7I9VST3_9BACT|nr:2-amino-4-hydroxy-6-hydroxymethyldihydropteridine diphosphokinase [Anaeromyxobacter diazotrophicus]GEJ59361.1 2-amino-4-hydroxy-6-hydroxymethyldihydropteridine diphosphokinase [Anaeromyxobacter diazotrophicus]